jgi:SNF2 family DNA or RNA helicase
MVTDISAEKKNKLFALVLSEHRIWGQIFMPYIITEQPGDSFYRLTECLSPFPNTDTLSTLNDEERETVKIINEYTDRNLFRLFSREKNVKEFLEVVSKDRVDSFIRPFIEKRIYKCMTLSRDENIPVFARRMKSASLHYDDRLQHAPEKALPVFRFSRSPEQTTYNLCLESGGKKINLRDCPLEILCLSPCLIRQDSMIYFVSDIDGSKLKPFMTKDYVIIPKKNEVQYFRTFILNAVNNFKVEAKGFGIIHIEPLKDAVLEIDPGLRGYPVLILRYVYEGRYIYSNETSEGFTLFLENEGEYVFRKFSRNFEWEQRCREILGELGFFSDDDISFTTDQGDGKKRDDLHSLIENINRNYTELRDAGFTIISRLDRKYNFLPLDVGISSELVNDWFDLKAVVTIGEWKIPFSRLRKNILEDIREYVLPDGSIAVLPEAWFTRYRNLFELGTIDSDKLRIHKQHFALLADTLAEEPSGFERLHKLLIPGDIPVVEKPEGLNCEMRSYQAEGLNWLSFLQGAGLGGCLADDMGLGKTIQALALLQHNKENLLAPQNAAFTIEPNLFDTGKRLTSLIIVPASLVYNWENEIKRFVPGMKVYSYKGIQRKKSSSYFNEFDIILSSYHTIRQDIGIISAFHFHYIILDESQVIKNPGSMLYRTFTRLKSDFKLVLTGTPVENSLTDLWTQLNFVNPGLLGDLSFFRREFAGPIEKQGDDEKETRLRKIIQPFILRRTKDMVAGDLPPVTEQVVYCDMTEEQEKLYEEEKSAVRNSILQNIAASGIEKSAIVVLQGLMKLRQISNHPSMAYEDYNAGSGKFETVLQDLESVISEGHKILVFSSFVRHLDLFAAELRKKRTGFAMLTGASTNRERIVNSFQNDKDRKVFLISLKAGGVGLNLTAADYVFILDPWWNPASEMQALNRAHRIGQDKSVFVYRYITSKSIEEKISRLQERKSKLAETFIGSTNPLKDINIEEILRIIG